MEKKDIYEHLAKIYLDASQKRNKKIRRYSPVFKNLFFIGIAFIMGLGIFLVIRLNKTQSTNSQIAMVLCPEVVKINFHFDPVKKEIYSIDLNNLDLSRFKVLGFSVKKAHYQDTVSLRVEFNSAFREKSEIYLKDISHRWQDYKIALSDFKNISEWSDMLNLSFIVEEWNVAEKKGIVYIDNVRLLR
ncbi:MAG: hypothetical protein NC828_00635 [Candidatus Omnitrophica bacterium]|nr:hypothetical protein [Candidatus Omnitrophota bacterium]